MPVNIGDLSVDLALCRVSKRFEISESFAQPTVEEYAINRHAMYRTWGREHRSTMRSCRSASQNLTVKRNIRVRHAIDTEPFRDGPSNVRPIESFGAFDRGNRLVETVDKKPGHAVLDKLGHGAAAICDNRGSASHRLDDRQSERFVEIDEMKKVRRPRQGTGQSPRSRPSQMHPRR